MGHTDEDGCVDSSQVRKSKICNETNTSSQSCQIGVLFRFFNNLT